MTDEGADAADERAGAAVARAARLADLSRKVGRGQATPEETAELERLEDESARSRRGLSASSI